MINIYYFWCDFNKTLLEGYINGRKRKKSFNREDRK